MTIVLDQVFPTLSVPIGMYFYMSGVLDVIVSFVSCTVMTGCVHSSYLLLIPLMLSCNMHILILFGLLLLG